MNKILLVLLLTLTPSCAAMDSMLGAGPNDAPDASEQVIATGETIVRTVGDSILPGAGGAAALALGLFARAYVKKRKAAKVAP